jgi:hypothetical protein
MLVLLMTGSYGVGSVGKIYMPSLWTSVEASNIIKIIVSNLRDPIVGTTNDRDLRSGFSWHDIHAKCMDVSSGIKHY